MDTEQALPPGAVKAGPLSGLKVVEFAGIGPGPMCGLLLSDLGAQVLRVERMTPSGIGIPRPARFDLLNRGKHSVAVDIKNQEGVDFAIDLVQRSDALIEGFRPGTMERLGLGPDTCLARLPKLVYGRVTGFGQTGPLSHAAGHDLNYIALSGALHAIGRAGSAPTPPLNLVGDFAGGAMLLAFGITSALWCAQRGGPGQVVDAAMIDGAALLMTSLFGLYAADMHTGPRGTNLLDSGAPHYEVYRCADGEYVCVAPIEAGFREVLAREIGMSPQELLCLDRTDQWPAAREKLKSIFASRTRAQWCELLEGTDACFAPVLPPREAPSHPHHVARNTFIHTDGVPQPAPAPRFSATPCATPHAPGSPESRGLGWAAHWGITVDKLSDLMERGAVRIQR